MDQNNVQITFCASDIQEKDNFAFKFVSKTTIFSGLSIFSGAAPVAIPEGGDATPTPEKDGEVVFDSFLRKKKFMSII